MDSVANYLKGLGFIVIVITTLKLNVFKTTPVFLLLQKLNFGQQLAIHFEVHINQSGKLDTVGLFRSVLQWKLFIYTLIRCEFIHLCIFFGFEAFMLADNTRG